MVLFFTHILFVVNHTFNATPPERLQQHPLLFTTNRTDRTFFVWGWTRHDLHILVTAPFCCDGKSRVACTQSFALWQQATVQFTCHDHYIIACLRHICMVLFFTHIPFVVNHTFNATPLERLQQYLTSKCELSCFLSLEQRFLNYFWCLFFSISHWCLHLSQPHNQTQKQQKTLFAIIVIFNTMLLAHPCSYSKYFMPLCLRTQGLVQKAIKQRWWNCIITALFNCITVVLCG